MFKKTKKITIKIPKECSLGNLSDAVVRAAGGKTARVKCDYSKLVVSRDIYNAFKTFIESHGWDQSAADAIWTGFRLSINESFVGGEVEISEGFFVNTSSNPTQKGLPTKVKFWIPVMAAFVVHMAAQYSVYLLASGPVTAVTAPLITALQIVDIAVVVFATLSCLIWIRREILLPKSKVKAGK